MRLCGIEPCGVESGVVCIGAFGEPLANGEAPGPELESTLKGEVSPVAVEGDGAEANRLAALTLESGEDETGGTAGSPSGEFGKELSAGSWNVSP
jgi:hypothetical protein